MTRLPELDPIPGDPRSVGAIETIVVPRAVDLGGFEVRRALPSAERQMVGPFIFFDQFGPADFIIGEGIDVRPHPHINLATVTYLFDGEIFHRDSLGTAQAIRPGAVNWMTAGRGIVHSERTAPEVRAKGARLFGLQTWVALPQDREEVDPDFTHYAKDDLPMVSEPGMEVRLVVGSLYGAHSPVRTLSPMFLAEARLAAGASLPLAADYEERGIYVVSGTVEIAGERFPAGQLLVFRPGDRLAVRAVDDARLALVGGEPMEGPRYIWWNFVSSRKERIEQAKAEWAAAQFHSIPGDADEFIPLPEKPGVALYP